LGGASVTVSIGGSFYRLGDTSTSVLARADIALYRAKNKGRNLAELEGEADSTPRAPLTGADAGSAPPPARPA
jgi:predicted signal transduction protein with EAL and GGDEF domain